MTLSTDWTHKILVFLENNAENNDAKIDVLCAEFEHNEKNFLKAFYRINNIELELQMEDYILNIFQPTFKNIIKQARKGKINNFKAYLEKSLVNELNQYKKKAVETEPLPPTELKDEKNLSFPINTFLIIKEALEDNKIIKPVCKIYFEYFVVFLEKKIKELATEQKKEPQNIKMTKDEATKYKMEIMENAKKSLKNQSIRADGTVNNQITNCIYKMGEYILTETQEIINKTKENFNL